MLEHINEYPRINDALRRISSSSIDELRNVDFVKNLIRTIGLYGANPTVYGNEEQYGTHDDSGVWQEPTQSAKFLVWLSKQKVQTMLEVGSWNGCWALFMSAYLSKFGMIKAISLDIENTVLPIVRSLSQQHNLTFMLGSSIDFENQSFDFAFIDGGRDYPIVQGHWDNVGKYARICAFHDINCRFAPDIKVFWDSIKTKTSLEILDHDYYYSYDIMGIGVICS